MQKGSQLLSYGLAVLAAVSFFIGWNIVLPDRLHLPLFNGTVNAPITDFAGLLLLANFFVAVVLGVYIFTKESWRTVKIGLFLFGLFIVSSVISALMVYHQDIALSLKYVLRSQIFVFLTFFALPIAIVEDRQSFLRVLYVWLVLAGIIALYGLSSFFVLDTTIRVMPYSFGSFAPLGVNQNALAETLLGILPFGIIVFAYLRTKNTSTFSLSVVAAILMLSVLAALLTLSRSAWIVLALQAIFITYWYSGIFANTSKLFARIVLVGVLFVTMALAWYMGFFLASSSAVSSSNSSRGMMWMIVIDHVKVSPVLGEGPGTFYRVIGETYAFIKQFGAPLEAHGVLQKILLEQGMLGTIVFSSFILWVWWFIYRTQQQARGYEQLVARLLFLAAVGSVVFQLFSTSYYTATLWLPLGMSIAGALLIRRRAL